jgi:hypothetical protein
VVLEGALNGLLVRVGIERERVHDVYPLDHEHAVVGLDLADRLAR